MSVDTDELYTRIEVLQKELERVNKLQGEYNDIVAAVMGVVNVTQNRDSGNAYSGLLTILDKSTVVAFSKAAYLERLLHRY